MYGRKGWKGLLAAAFAVGLLLSSFCPSQLIIVLLAVAVIMLGVTCNGGRL